MANSTISRNYFYPQPIEDFATLQEARRVSANLKGLSWCFEIIGRAGLFVASYQVLEYGFRAFHLRSTLIAVATSIAGLALSRLCQWWAVKQLAGLTKEKELSIHFKYYKQYLENQPLQAGIKGYLTVGDALSLEEQQELLDLAYPKGILVIFNQYEAKLNFQEWRETGFVKLEKRHPYIYKQIYNSYGCIIDFIEKRLTNMKKIENPDKKNLDLEFINEQLEFLSFKWTGTTANAKAAHAVNLIPLFSVKNRTTVVLGASACLLGAEIIPYLKFFASRGFNIEMDCSYLAPPIDETYLKPFNLTRGQPAKQTTIHTIDTIQHEEIDPLSRCLLNLKNELASIRKLVVSQSTKGKTPPPSVEEQAKNLKYLKAYLRHCYPAICWNFIENESISKKGKKESSFTETEKDEETRLRERREIRERRQSFMDKYKSRCEANQVKNTNDEKIDT